MIDARDIVQTALDEAMYPRGVTSHWQQLEPVGKKDPTEYITYSIVSAVPVTFADGQPLDIRHVVDVNYYAQRKYHDRGHITERITQIQEAMKAAGFAMPDEGRDLLNPDVGGWVGVNLECWLYRVRDNG